MWLRFTLLVTCGLIPAALAINCPQHAPYLMWSDELRVEPPSASVSSCRRSGAEYTSYVSFISRSTESFLATKRATCQRHSAAELVQSAPWLPNDVTEEFRPHMGARTVINPDGTQSTVGCRLTYRATYSLACCSSQNQTPQAPLPDVSLCHNNHGALSVPLDPEGMSAVGWSVGASSFDAKWSARKAHTKALEQIEAKCKNQNGTPYDSQADNRYAGDIVCYQGTDGKSTECQYRVNKVCCANETNSGTPEPSPTASPTLPLTPIPTTSPSPNTDIGAEFTSPSPSPTPNTDVGAEFAYPTQSPSPTTSP